MKLSEVISVRTFIYGFLLTLFLANLFVPIATEKLALETHTNTNFSFGVNPDFGKKKLWPINLTK